MMANTFDFAITSQGYIFQQNKLAKKFLFEVAKFIKINNKFYLKSTNHQWYSADNINAGLVHMEGIPLELSNSHLLVKDEHVYLIQSNVRETWLYNYKEK